MQKKLRIFCLALSMLCFISGSYAQAGKSEVAVGYGYYSIYTLVNGVPFNTSSGTTGVTYRYYVSRNVTLGLGFGYENISNWGSFTSFVPELTVAYLDTRNTAIRVRLYGSVSYGITVFSDNETSTSSHADQSGVWAYAFQATPIGMRIGRQFAFFTEVGIGYKGLFHLGVEGRFPRISAKNRHREEN